MFTGWWIESGQSRIFRFCPIFLVIHEINLRRMHPRTGPIPQEARERHPPLRLSTRFGRFRLPRGRRPFLLFVAVGSGGLSIAYECPFRLCQEVLLVFCDNLSPVAVALVAEQLPVCVEACGPDMAYGCCVCSREMEYEGSSLKIH